MSESLVARENMLPSPFLPSPNETIRPISAPRTKSNASSRFWKWKTRFPQAERQELSHTSLTTSMPSPVSNLSSRNARKVASPYLSESAHILSLQHPAERIESHTSDKNGVRTSESKEATIKTGEDSNLTETGLDAQQSTSRISSRSVGSKDIGPQEPNLSKIDDYFLIPLGIGPQPSPEHDKDDAEISDREIRSSEDMEVGCGPVKTIPWASFCTNDNFNTAISQFPGNYASNGRGHSRWQPKGLLQLVNASHSFDHILFTLCAFKAKASRALSKQRFFAAA
ncbi:hypothetical protein E4U53_002600 [Claviceps sorghi]|nr:hypothetical protein E4U53_002600 [Claviceps sorghi]